MDAIDAGVSVMLFSDNVAVADEVALGMRPRRAGCWSWGRTAARRGQRVALGFANVVAAGSVGLVAASGTGAQQVMCLLDAAGVGSVTCWASAVAICRPPSVDAQRQALAMLAADEGTTSIIVVSKPPAPGGARRTSRRMPLGWASRCTGRSWGPAGQDLTASVESALGCRRESA